MTTGSHEWEAGDPAELLAQLPLLVVKYLAAEAAGDPVSIVEHASALLKATQGSVTHARAARESACANLHANGWTLPEIAAVAHTTPQRIYAIIRGIRGGKARDGAVKPLPRTPGRPRKDRIKPA